MKRIFEKSLDRLRKRHALDLIKYLFEIEVDYEDGDNQKDK